MNPVLEIAAGALAGGGLQVVSEVFKMGGSLISGLRDSAIANNEQYRLNTEARQASMDAAAKRSPSWLRGTLGVIVFVSAFVFPFYAGWLDVPTSIVSNKEPWFNLFGIIKAGGGVVVTEAKGFVQGEYFGSTVRAVAGAVFGVGAVSTGRRIS